MTHKIRDRKILKSFGENLKNVRVKQKMTQEELAYSAGIAVSSVGRMETGNLNTTICTVVKMADAMGIDKKQLLDF